MAVVAITGTQRIVTVLFADVVGSTAIGEQVGPERSKFLFDEIVSLIGSEVRRFDGTVAQLLGDGLFAVFGAPVGHEDDAERAVRAALAIQDVICTYGEELRSGYGVELAVLNPSGEIDYYTPVTGDVLAWLTPPLLIDALHDIAAL